jgi:hypothetical protein
MFPRKIEPVGRLCFAVPGIRCAGGASGPTRKGPLTSSIIGLDGEAMLFNIEQKNIHE